MENLEQTILSQYANSPILMALIEDLNGAIDPSVDIDLFYDSVWNILTATGVGLDFWGRIVNVSRVITVVSGSNFGFKEEGANAHSFGQAPFFNGTPATSNYILSDDAYRALVLVKALANISNCAIPTYNKMLGLLFPGRGLAYATDLGSMMMRLTFEFTLEPFEISILKNSGALQAPTGVQFNIMDFPVARGFGFAEAGRYAGFGHGAFFAGYV